MQDFDDRKKGQLGVVLETVYCIPLMPSRCLLVRELKHLKKKKKATYKK